MSEEKETQQKQHIIFFDLDGTVTTMSGGRLFDKIEQQRETAEKALGEPLQESFVKSLQDFAESKESDNLLCPGVIETLKNILPLAKVCFLTNNYECFAKTILKKTQNGFSLTETELAGIEVIDGTQSEGYLRLPIKSEASRLLARLPKEYAEDVRWKGSAMQTKIKAHASAKSDSRAIFFQDVENKAHARGVFEQLLAGEISLSFEKTGEFDWTENGEHRNILNGFLMKKEVGTTSSALSNFSEGDFPPESFLSPLPKRVTPLSDNSVGFYTASTGKRKIAFPDHQEEEVKSCCNLG